MEQEAPRTSYIVHYTGSRECDVVYSTAAITRVARGDKIQEVIARVSQWYGSWDDDPPTRNYKILSERVMHPDEYR